MAAPADQETILSLIDVLRLDVYTELPIHLMERHMNPELRQSAFRRNFPARWDSIPPEPFP